MSKTFVWWTGSRHLGQSTSWSCAQVDEPSSPVLHQPQKNHQKSRTPSTTSPDQTVTTPFSEPSHRVPSLEAVSTDIFDLSASVDSSSALLALTYTSISPLSPHHPATRDLGQEEMGVSEGEPHIRNIRVQCTAVDALGQSIGLSTSLTPGLSILGFPFWAFHSGLSIPGFPFRAFHSGLSIPGFVSCLWETKPGYEASLLPCIQALSLFGKRKESGLRLSLLVFSRALVLYCVRVSKA